MKTRRAKAARNRDMQRHLRRIGIALIIVCSIALLPVTYFDLRASDPSRCIGTTKAGHVAGAVRPAITGSNYRSYCVLCVLALRTYGHSHAVGVMEDAYEAMLAQAPETSFIYGEIGWPWGGSFYPHRTHRNGLSVDFMVPLVNGELKTSLFNRFGYDEVFDADGRGEYGTIDFDAMAQHLLALDEAAQARGGGIRIVILAPNLQDDLFAAKNGELVRQRVRFNRAPSWVRHDDHYHVDFDFACAA